MIPGPRRLPSAMLALAVALLPRAYRPRYRVELAAELSDVPQGQQSSYALRVLVRSLTLRSALTTYRPTIGEIVMTSRENPYNTSDLHHRQQIGDYGHTVLGSEERVTSRKRWKPLLLPLVLIVVGVVLGLWGPLPGLGMFLVMGGAMGLVVAAVGAFNDLFS